jgi:hypothetical protein
MKSNTKYRVKAKVWKVSGNVGIGVYGWDGSTAEIYHAATTTGAWEDIDFTFTSGATLKADGHGIFFNNGTGYIDNWEMYEVADISLSSSSLTYLSSGTQKVAVSGKHLASDITITAPANFTVSPATLPAAANGDSVAISFDGLATSNGYVYFASGAEKDSVQVSGVADPTVVTSVKYLTFDELNKVATFTVTGGNLSDSIRITTPSGYVVDAKALSPKASGTTVTVTFDGLADSKGYINLTSGTASATVRVIGTLNSTLFTPISATGNLIKDPYFNSLNTYAGWGNKTITTDTTEVYSGSRSLKMQGSCGASLDYSLTGIVKANTTYRIRAMVKTTGTYKFMINGCGVGGSTSDHLLDVNTNGQWKQFDTTFTTGTLASSSNIYLNSCEGYSGTLIYVDNYELYVLPTINTSPSVLLFSGAGKKSFTVMGESLTQAITITAPAGFTVSPQTLAASTTNASVSVTYDGVAEADAYVYLTSGTAKDSVRVAGSPLEPAISVTPKSLTFAGAETKTFSATGTGLSQSITITAPEGFTVSPESISASASATTVSVTYDGVAAKTGYILLVSGTTKDSVSVTGTTTGTGIETVGDAKFSPNAYIQNGLINLTFDLAQPATVELAVYNSTGRLLAKQKGKYLKGSNHVVLNVNLLSGLYIINIIKDGESSSCKVVK